jgi:hypothetical protein
MVVADDQFSPQYCRHEGEIASEPARLLLLDPFKGEFWLGVSFGAGGIEQLCLLQESSERRALGGASEGELSASLHDFACL